MTTLAQAYQHAAQQFLLKDFIPTAQLIESSIPPSLSPSQQREWYDHLTSDSPTSTAAMTTTTILRKFYILKITLVATVHSLEKERERERERSGDDLARIEDYPSTISTLLSLPAKQSLQKLWHSLLPFEAASDPSESDIFPTPLAAFLHPSLAVALVLAALKMDEPVQAKLIGEAWFGSVDEGVERFIWEDVSEDVNGTTADAVAHANGHANGNGHGDGMTGSSLLLPSLPPTPSKPLRVASGSQEKTLASIYVRLFDLIALGVLPKLGEYEAARDFVRSHARENGGWLSAQKIEETLRQLEGIEIGASLYESRQLERSIQYSQRREKEAAAAAAQKEERERARKSRDRKGKGKETSSNSTSNSNSSSSAEGSPNSKHSSSQRQSRSTTKPVPYPPTAASPSSSAVTGFASLRSSLTSYLSQSPSNPNASSNATSHPPPPLTLSTLPTHILSLLNTTLAVDPIRLLSLICFVFALRSWLRRRRERGLGGVRETLVGFVRGVGSKVGETVRMGTKVTSL